MSREQKPRDEAIDLSREVDVTLGSLSVRPASCEVVQDGVSRRLEPRVMQVLVALAQSAGSVVSRDRLIARCWRGVVVGEDAIQRAVARVRRLSEVGDFILETIPKVGYRLTLNATAAPGPATGAAEPLLAVLAFDDLSGDPDLAFFSEGVSDEILQTVSRGLRVIGRASSFQYRGADKAVRKVAGELGATHVLDGSVRRGQGMIRISVQLIETAGQTTIWQGQYDRPLRDLFAVQDEVAAAVAAALNCQLTPTPAGGVIDPETYELYLRLRHLVLAQRGGQIELADEVTRRAPLFGPGWIEAARARVGARFDVAHKEGEVQRLQSEAQAALARAAALLPAHDEALTALSVNMTPWCGAWTACEQRLVQALRQAPRSITLQLTLGDLLKHAGRMSDAITVVRDLYEREPLHARYAMAYAYALDGLDRHEEQIAVLEAACRRWPNAPFVWQQLVDSAAAQGRWDTVEAWTSAERIAQLESPALVRRVLRTVERRRDLNSGGRDELLARLAQTIEQTGRARMETIVFVAEHADVAKVHDLIERASFAHVVDPLQAFGDTICLFMGYAKRLRGDPRFVKLCARLGLAKHWLETGRWPDCAHKSPYDFRREAERYAAVPVG